MEFDELIQNPWVVGIICGIISGIIVYFFTVNIIEKRSSQRKRDNIANANKALINLLGPYITNYGLPNMKQLEAITNSIARQYRVKRSEINSIIEIYEDLLTEYVRNPYIPERIKRESVNALVKNIDLLKVQEEEKVTEQSDNSHEKNKRIQFIGLLIGVIYGMMIFFVSTYLISGEIMIVIIIMAIEMLVAVIYLVYAVYSSKRKQNIQNIKEKALSSSPDLFVDKIDLKIHNRGTSLNESFNKDFEFINYFKDDD